jgi:hypothetical protein
LCLRRQRDAKHRRQLDISVGMSGPHDFAVRDNTPRRECINVHRFPHPTFVTTRTPLISGCGIARINKSASTEPRSEIFLRGDLDSQANHRGGFWCLDGPLIQLRVGSLGPRITVRMDWPTGDKAAWVKADLGVPDPGAPLMAQSDIPLEFRCSLDARFKQMAADWINDR